MTKIKTNPLSRHHLANPFTSETRNVRLAQKGAIDLTDNKIVKHLDNKYWSVEPIDKTKKFKKR